MYRQHRRSADPLGQLGQSSEPATEPFDPTDQRWQSAEVELLPCRRQRLAGSASSHLDHLEPDWHPDLPTKDRLEMQPSPEPVGLQHYFRPPFERPPVRLSAEVPPLPAHA